jgi:hypothetical protein
MSDESMNTEESAPAPEAAASEEARSEWQTVLDHVDELGDAIGRWAKAAVNDPDNRRRVEELREHLDRIGENIGDSIKSASESESGQQMKDAANKAGTAIADMGQRFGEEVLPKMAAAFESAADKLADAADRMESRADETASAETAGEGAPEGDE